jgi:hypothetical protein
MKKIAIVASIVTLALSSAAFAQSQAVSSGTSTSVGVSSYASSTNVGGAGIGRSKSSSHGHSVSRVGLGESSTMTRCVKNVSVNVEETVCQTRTLSNEEAQAYFQSERVSGHSGGYASASVSGHSGGAGISEKTAGISASAQATKQ